MADIWDVEHLRVGGGTEGEEYVACSAKVMLESEKYWRLFAGNKVFSNIQAAIDSLT